MPTTDIHVTLEIKVIHPFCVKVGSKKDANMQSNTFTQMSKACINMTHSPNADSQDEFNIPPIVELNTKPALPVVGCDNDCPLVNVKAATAGPLVNCKRSAKPKLTAKR
uniref:Uncharacterized protein n=1 Tax=Romanomermis culicivorax TaxID=13658 RepID=A0A915KP43_ROMCU